MKYTEITQNDLTDLRTRLLEHQNHKCAICEKDLSSDDTLNQHIDHQHLFKKDNLGEHGNGLIRGVLCRNCNSLEGKLWNNIHRFGFADSDNPVESRKQFIEKVIAYYDKPFYNIEPILHPKERRPEVLGKREYNSLIKFWKTLPSSYKRNGELKPQPKFTKRWSNTLKEIKRLKEENDFSDK